MSGTPKTIKFIKKSRKMSQSDFYWLQRSIVANIWIFAPKMAAAKMWFYQSICSSFGFNLRYELRKCIENSALCIASKWLHSFLVDPVFYTPQKVKSSLFFYSFKHCETIPFLPLRQLTCLKFPDFFGETIFWVHAVYQNKNMFLKKLAHFLTKYGSWSRYW